VGPVGRGTFCGDGSHFFLFLRKLGRNVLLFSDRTFFEGTQLSTTPPNAFILSSFPMMRRALSHSRKQPSSLLQRFSTSLAGRHVLSSTEFDRKKLDEVMMVLVKQNAVATPETPVLTFSFSCRLHPRCTPPGKQRNLSPTLPAKCWEPCSSSRRHEQARHFRQP
jgi:hypothetical protein